MREILFRGKTTAGRWIEGSLVTLKDDNRTLYYITPQDELELIAVRPETVGQYTGRKDSRDNPIFEGDEVIFCMLATMELEAKEITGEVIFFSYEWVVVSKIGIFSLDMLVLPSVIGNIHDK